MAGGKDALKAMVGVSKTWRAGYEDSVSRICQELPRIEGLPLLPRFNNHVNTLTLTYNLSNFGLWALRGSGIRTLDISGCAGIDARVLATLAGALLESLALRMAEENVAGLETLQNLPNLNSLTLRVVCPDCDMEDERFPSLCKLTSLTKFYLSNEGGGEKMSSPSCYPFDQAMKAVQELPIRDLSFDVIGYDYNYLSGRSFEYLRGLPLTNLELHGCHQVNDEGLENLRGLPLTSLALWGKHYNMDDRSELSESGLNFSVVMPLTSLTFSGFHTNCFETLRGLPLTNLSLSFERKIKVNDARAEVFSSLPLTHLRLRGCRLTRSANARLRALLLESFDV